MDVLDIEQEGFREFPWWMYEITLTFYLSLLKQQSEPDDANYAVVDVEMWDKKKTLTGIGD